MKKEEGKNPHIQLPPNITLHPGSPLGNNLDINLPAPERQPASQTVDKGYNQPGAQQYQQPVGQYPQQQHPQPIPHQQYPQHIPQQYPQPPVEPGRQPVGQQNPQQPYPQPIAQQNPQQPYPQPIAQQHPQQPYPQPIAQQHPQQPYPQPIAQQYLQQPCPQSFVQPSNQPVNQQYPQPAQQPVIQCNPQQNQIVQNVNQVMVVEQMPTNAPGNMQCPHCNISVVTIIQPIIGIYTWMIAVLLFFLGCWPCLFIPFFVSSCMDVQHSCPRCNNVLHIYNLRCWPFCLIPFCVDSCKEEHQICPQCKSRL
ncbi:cell death-inducing p53-target protein 1 homolog [Cyprinodon tularosa]|uniref:cell death-inducing p53-target protein 1 homolog n=1 Tax=Cyprinodon tularosa TaxID=77115 RepID=UPI0018E1EF4D|nr:cell death-inducing p53-target protein 1 homolog [Cyprinodon tularosa]